MATPTGLRSVLKTMSSVTQSRLSSFHQTTKASTLDDMSMLTTMTVKPESVITVTDITDHTSFKREYLDRKIRDYVIYVEIPSPGNPWVTWDDSKTSFRFHIAYNKLLDDCRTLQYISNAIYMHMSCLIHTSSDFGGVMDIEVPEMTDTLWSMTNQVMDLQLGVPGILGYDSNTSTIIGCNMLEILNCKYIKDPSSIVSTDIDGVQKYLGVDAAWEVIRRMTNGNTIIAGYATASGVPRSFIKHGSDKPPGGWVASMALEHPSLDIKRIGAKDKGETDHVTSVHTEYMVGNKPCNIGSRSRLFDVINMAS